MSNDLDGFDLDTQGLALRVIKMGSGGFLGVTKKTSARGLPKRPTTLLYDALALRYNQLAVGDLLLLALPHRPTVSNLRKILESRGVLRTDYRLFRPLLDEQGNCWPANHRPLVLQRLTDGQMRAVHHFHGLAARLAEEAEERGATYNFAQPENPAKPGPAAEISAGNEVLVNT